MNRLVTFKIPYHYLVNTYCIFVGQFQLFSFKQMSKHCLRTQVFPKKEISSLSLIDTLFLIHVSALP